MRIYELRNSSNEISTFQSLQRIKIYICDYFADAIKRHVPTEEDI